MKKITFMIEETYVLHHEVVIEVPKNYSDIDCDNIADSLQNELSQNGCRVIDLDEVDGFKVVDVVEEDFGLPNEVECTYFWENE